MDTVNAFKKLLDLNLENLRLNPTDIGNLESINQQSEKLNTLLVRNVFNQQVESNNQSDMIPLGDKTSHSGHNIVAENSHNTDADHRIKAPDAKNDFKIRKITPPPMPNVSNIAKEKPTQKRPFLKKGEGLRRFCLADPNQLEASSDLTTAGVKSHQKKPIERACPKATIFSRAPCTEEGESQAIQAKLKSRKIVPISTNTSLKTSDLPRVGKKSESKSSQIDRFGPLLNTHSRGKLNIYNNSLLKNPAKNSSETQILSTTLFDSDESRYNQSLDVVRQIENLEKRLLELMHLKSSLSQEDHEKYEDKDEELISSQLDQILDQITKLNSKLTPLSDPKSDFVTENRSNNNIDIKSRDFGVAPKINSESTISTLSNGDKIRLSKDHSLTYEHLNGVSQTIFQDGLKVVHFPNGQIERMHSNGTRQIIYSNGQQRTIRPDHSEEILLNDGRVCTFYADGTEKIEYQSGDIEYKTAEYTKRYFRNGDIKTVYANGCHETIYSNGRIRMKDPLGNVVFDQTP